jgi:hypothetical protein
VGKLECCDSRISRAEARELFRVDSYSDEASRQSKVTRLQGLFDHDPALAEFLEAAAAALNLNEAPE